MPSAGMLGRPSLMVWLAKSLLWLLARIPLSWLRRLSRWVGWVGQRLNTEAAQITDANLAYCYPDMDSAARHQLVRDSLSHTAMLGFEAGFVWRKPVAQVLQLVQSTQGRDELSSALAASPGVLLLLPHLGNWEFMSPWLSEFGVTALYDPPNIKALDPIVRASRERAGIRMLPINGAGLRAVYEALRANSEGDHGMVVVLPDQVPSRQAGSVLAPFFGQPAHTMTLIHRLVKRTKPQVLIGAALRVPGGFHVEVRSLPSDAFALSAEQAAVAMNRAIEGLVALHPAQYQWEYKRFKRTEATVALYGERHSKRDD